MPFPMLIERPERSRVCHEPLDFPRLRVDSHANRNVNHPPAPRGEYVPRADHPRPPSPGGSKMPRRSVLVAARHGLRSRVFRKRWAICSGGGKTSGHGLAPASGGSSGTRVGSPRRFGAVLLSARRLGPGGARAGSGAAAGGLGGDAGGRFAGPAGRADACADLLRRSRSGQRRLLARSGGWRRRFSPRTRIGRARPIGCSRASATRSTSRWSRCGWTRSTVPARPGRSCCTSTISPRQTRLRVAPSRRCRWSGSCTAPSWRCCASSRRALRPAGGSRSPGGSGCVAGPAPARG